MDIAIALLLWVFVAAYATFGGADFGAGVWDLFAGGAERGKRPRALIDSAITPVWEANNVWLIFALVLFWTGFPEAFASVMSTQWIPLTLAALCIVLRGSAFAFRHTMRTVSSRRFFGAVFAAASLAALFFLGTVLGGIASGRVPAGELGAGDQIDSWWNPTSIAVGVLAVIAGAYIAAAFLVYESSRRANVEMQHYFRWRALIAALAAGGWSFITFFILREDAPYVYEGLLHEGLPLVIASVVFGLGGLWAIWKNKVRLGRMCAVLGVGSVVWAWGAAQYPYLLPESLTVQQASADPATQAWLIAMAIGATLLVGPALVLLYWLDQKGELVAGEKGEALDAVG